MSALIFWFTRLGRDRSAGAVLVLRSPTNASASAGSSTEETAESWLAWLVNAHPSEYSKLFTITA